MKGLTQKQKDILNFIRRFMNKEKMAPTVYEIGDHFNIKTSTVFAHIKSLQKKNFLTRSSKARSIALTDKKPARGRTKDKNDNSLVPLLGRAAAGFPVDAPENLEGMVQCDQEILDQSSANVYALKIDGESMRDAGILHGDIVYVDHDRAPKEGEIVVALVNNETTVKSFYPHEDTVELRPANPDYPTQTYSADEVSAQGVVVGLRRLY